MLHDGKGHKITLSNNQQKKAQTLSGWNSFVGKQTLFDQLSKLKKNMYVSNGRQDQGDHIYTDYNHNLKDYQNQQIGDNAIYIGESKVSTDTSHLSSLLLVIDSVVTSN